MSISTQASTRRARGGSSWRPLVVVAVLLLLAPLVACGGGGGHYYSPAPVGTLEVANDFVSSETIEMVDVSTLFGPVEHHDVLIFPGDSGLFDLFDDSYDVDVFWSDGRVDHLTVDVYDGLTTTVVLQNY